MAVTSKTIHRAAKKASTDPVGQLLQELLAGKSAPPPLQRLVGEFENPSRSDDGCQAEFFELWGSQGRLIVSALACRLNRPLLFITGHIPDADMAQDDLETFLPTPPVLLPAFETLDGQAETTSEIACERLRICQEMALRSASAQSNSPSPVIVASIAALIQPVPSVAFIQNQSLPLAINTDPENGIEGVATWLTDQAYLRVDRVDGVGEFAVRGGIVDIFAPGQDQPVRIEFFGDTVESLRLFDLDTQRSTQSLDGITFSGCRPTMPEEETSFLQYLPDSSLVVMEETAEIAEVGKLYLQRVKDSKGLYSSASIFQKSVNHDMLILNRLESGLFLSKDNRTSPLPLSGQSIQRFENKGVEGLDELLIEAADRPVFLFCENSAQVKRMEEMIRESLEKEVPENLHLPLGYVHQGFADATGRFTVIGHHELFGLHPQRRRFRRMKTIQTIDSFSDLETDDLVVHVNHGIGRFRGMKTLEKNGRKEEYLAIEYAAKAMIHVPAGKIDLVHKYVGAGGVVKLSRLGGKAWDRQKQKVADAVEDMAGDLLDLQAHRQLAEGIRFPSDTLWQREFEQIFPYQETDDQLTAVDEIKEDMHQPRPMDRLLCGDVGYGKTELAIRACFKAMEYGKQVAMLVPTTVLAQQHFRTFTERLADFPFQVEVLSRFKTAGQAKTVVADCARGQIDILIGTHRLLSDDVKFKDLGLVIIDEEQRFGVSHKEKLKKMRKTVDVLTLTATPIPRTLHLALLGIRDISALETPPLDRRSIVTEVCGYERERIRQIINRELAREGQVYFVHNRVNDILSVADTLSRLVPDARISVAHGQMPKHELEERMLEFVTQKTDILVCTTIIESGLDIPTANTLIVNDADRFGLAQLHQLRGRVGRYKNRAYAYMLLPQKRVINPTALKRLKAIEEYSQLGSGFRIAMRDLEIRGAGNILGAEQSGHIDAVGYEMYCRLLASAVKHRQSELEKEPSEQEGSRTAAMTATMKTAYPTAALTQLDLDIHNHVPRSYIPSDRQRMDVYRRLANCQSRTDLEQLECDLKDQFGKIPRVVDDLLQLAEVRLLAADWDIRSIVEHRPDLIFTMNSMQKVKNLFQTMEEKVRILDGQRVYLRLRENYFDTPATILAFLRKLLKS
jgi:transcription-repair coupling factor (superfamily II helicase)